MLSEIRSDTTILIMSAPLRQSYYILFAGCLHAESSWASVNFHLWVTLAAGVFLICYHPKAFLCFSSLGVFSSPVHSNGGEDGGLTDVSALWFTLKNSNTKQCCSLKQGLRFVQCQNGLHVA